MTVQSGDGSDSMMPALAVRGVIANVENYPYSAQGPNELALTEHCQIYGYNWLDAESLRILRNAGYTSENAARILLHHRKKNMGDRLYDIRNFVFWIRLLREQEGA